MLGCSQGALEAFLGCSWCIFWRSWDTFWRSLGVLGSILATLGAFLWLGLAGWGWVWAGWALLLCWALLGFAGLCWALLGFAEL